MKRIVGLLVVLGVGLMPLRAQTTRAIRQLEQQRNELKEQIAASETLLQSRLGIDYRADRRTAEVSEYD